ncbi:hypothetical protein CI105_06265 [Candidatus Izimaplasma bacterium ZiA1]|uniref:hypothetical protein n=1 Tax=Candidatus Izimoplasma sp. ZiA1 TaxID=2024899 RepID=UPI000BAA535B|nr:hypothetical protein CI105_06265 [Candidatus Izimaplasma bacterium ZiA1]
MNNKKYIVKLKLKETKDRIIDLLLQYDYYNYERFVTDINDNSNLIVLEYRSAFQNVYQSITIVVTSDNDECDVLIYESKTTLSISNMLNSKKEVERIIQFLLKQNVEILYKEYI